MKSLFERNLNRIERACRISEWFLSLVWLALTLFILWIVFFAPVWP